MVSYQTKDSIPFNVYEVEREARYETIAICFNSMFSANDDSAR
jgi:hypothetical protein